MENIFYLLNMTVSGIKSIKTDVRLDFYKKTIDRSFDPERYRVKAIYGENGAGKTAIVTSLKIFQDLLINDNYLSESNNQYFLDEIINKETKLFKFCCEFIVNIGENLPVFQYCIHLGKNSKDLYEIKYEKLMKKNGSYPNNNYQTMYECINGELISIALDELSRENVEKKTMNLLSAHPMLYLYITSFNKEEIERNQDKGNDDFSFDMVLCFTLAVFLKIYLAEEDQHELYFMQKRLKEIELDSPELGGNMSEIKEYLASVSSVNERKINIEYFEKYQNKIARLTEFIKIFKSDLVSIDIDKKEDGKYYTCELLMNYGNYRVNKEFESTGIKKLIRLFDCFMMASEVGIVFIDEMDSNLNDVYLCKLIEYFMYYGKGQLCFTTHNLDPMMILKENKNSIDFLSSDNHLMQWTARGNSTPDSCYRNGMIENLPFNVDATDFIGIFGE